MHPSCTHIGYQKAQFCQRCAAVRDSVELPWRALTDLEKRRNKLVTKAANAVIDALREDQWTPMEIKDLFGGNKKLSCFIQTLEQNLVLDLYGKDIA